MDNVDSESKPINIANSISRAMSVVESIKNQYPSLEEAYNEAEKYNTTVKAEQRPSEARAAATKLRTACSDLSVMDASALKQAQDKNFWNNGGGRALVDATGATLLGVAGGVTTAQIMKESNRTQFTAEQQEWMNDVGRHITCYIGGDEAGSYGDIITTSLE